MTDLIKPTSDEGLSEKAQIIKQVGGLSTITLFIFVIGAWGWRALELAETVLIEVLRPGVVALEDMRDTYSPDAAKRRR